ncbi:hypothetical protein [Geodermatophilus arenarius]|uniref:LacI family transcriptional regulator n=1 Tax=Geodermatophilus arenarius TaxID=1137990 RepID=A0ABV9LE84_9ACTN
MTTVAQPLGEMTRQMTDLVPRRVEGSAEVEARVCPTRLVRRASA